MEIPKLPAALGGKPSRASRQMPGCAGLGGSLPAESALAFGVGACHGVSPKMGAV